MLDYAQVDEIIDGGLGSYLLNIQNQCAQIHQLIYETYIAYSIEDKFKTVS